MKDFLKDYGTLIGPTFAFILGVIAIYIKFYSDRQLDKWKSKRKLTKLIALIRDSKPPSKYYPKKSKDGFLHADQARNLTNASIFLKKVKVLNSFIDTVENDILTNCTVLEIQQFTDIKFIVAYLSADIEKFRNNIKDKGKIEETSTIDWNENDFFQLRQSFDRLAAICDNPQKQFNYIER